ncbi:unnamed protein product [Tetraodon nigroviridis]|uniref:(spotted green pufferfish) hypothetical protein n=1 Tax=Tetraodon nigroviridis TaxID=99883 RepID=Q4SF85_TETNG|nr:unnamed protein product [Tetraodon nigroviridis]
MLIRGPRSPRHHSPLEEAQGGPGPAERSHASNPSYVCPGLSSGMDTRRSRKVSSPVAPMCTEDGTPGKFPAFSATFCHVKDTAGPTRRGHCCSTLKRPKERFHEQGSIHLQVSSSAFISLGCLLLKDKLESLVRIIHTSAGLQLLRRAGEVCMSGFISREELGETK